MGPAPDFSTYESQAKATYEPQLVAEKTQAAAGHQANLNTLATEKGSVGTQYDIQEQTLADTIKSEAAQINQTYSTHLLGNFSGLQGNDMGQMFSKGNTQMNNIETERTNAINAINTSVANENLTYTANDEALTSKYRGLEEGAAASGYNSAKKEYNTELYQKAQLDLGYAKLAESAANRASSSGNQLRVLTSSIGGALQQSAGRDGYVSPQDYAAAKRDWISQGYSSAQFDSAFAGFRNPYAEDTVNGAKRSKADYAV